MKSERLLSDAPALDSACTGQRVPVRLQVVSTPLVAQSVSDGCPGNGFIQVSSLRFRVSGCRAKGVFRLVSVHATNLADNVAAYAPQCCTGNRHGKVRHHGGPSDESISFWAEAGRGSCLTSRPCLESTFAVEYHNALCCCERA